MPEPPAALPPLGRRFVEANGLRFGVTTCERETRGGRLALLLHGFPECWRSWNHQIPALAELGYRVWAPDLRGYGESDCPPRVADYALEALVEDVAGWVDAAEADSVTLVGHDWGAIVAWIFAVRKLRPLERLVIMNVPHPGAAAENFSWRQLLRSWYMIFFQLPRLPEALIRARGPHAFAEAIRDGMRNPGNVDEETVDLIAANLGNRERLTGMLHYYRALLRGGGGRRQSRLGFPEIETPTLMLWGVNDLALTVETTFATHRYVRDLTLRYLPEASHFVQQDAPVLVNRLLCAYLRGEPVPESGEAEGVRVTTTVPKT